MMKKITLFMLALAGFTLNAQTFFFEDFSSGTVGQEPAGFTVLNEDTCNVNSPTIFTNESWIVSDAAGDAQGNHAAAQSWTVPSCQVDDWLITPAIDLSTANATTTLSWLGRSFEGPTFPENYEVLISTTGNNVSDFLVTLTTVNGELETWNPRSVNLAAFVGDTVYIAFRLTSADQSQLWLDDIKVAQPPQYDGEVVGTVTNAVSQQNPLLSVPYLVLDFADRTSFEASVEVKNTGLLPTDSLYLAYYLVDDVNSPSIGVAFGDTVYLSTPLAPGATYTHTFSAFGIDTLFPGMATDATIDFYVQLDSSSYNQEFTVDDASYEILFAPTLSYEATVGMPYSSSFEIADLGAQQFIFEHSNWGWKCLDNNDDGNSLAIGQAYSNLPAQDGDFQVYGSIVNGNQLSVGATNDFLQSPNITLQSGSSYSFSIWARTGFGATGAIDVKLTNSDGTYNNSLGTINLVAADSAFSKFTFSATISNTADDYLVNFEKTAQGFLIIDNFELALLEQPAANVSLLASSVDEPGVNYCDSTVTVSFSATGNPSSLTLNWGDGTVETVTGMSTASHQYGAFGTYDISLIAENIVGADTAHVSLDFTDLPVANITLNDPTTSGTTVTYNLGTDVTNNLQYTPACARVIINWGDGTIEEVTGQNTASHTYAGSNTYNINATVISGSSQAQDSTSVVISSINGVNLAGLEIFPNPANNNLTVNFELDNTQNIDITVYTVTGNKVATQNFNANSVNTSFNTSNFNEGVYILKIETEKGVKTQKFVVKH
ncbi:MAG: choice-of-anchor J domain-containing protein [Bacteroidetes bacterium]|nr:choice-of-anchor J domain-containing protein [Bacteroidota bacterium]